MAQSGEEYLAVLKASYDYDPQSEDEIAIKENQTVFLLERTDEDWWKVKVKGNSQDEDSPSGLVPAAYVEQAEHTSLAKALYDYDAAAPGELSIKEDEILMVFDREDEWILVQSQKDGGKAGFVPGNYIEESNGEEAPEPVPDPEQDSEPELTPRHQLPPPSPNPPARPTSIYVDPADLVAQTPLKLQADHIRTWPVSEIDKKGKKKKGTLGIGNGSLFFASESDKTPVQKWDTADVEDFTIERHKHVLIDMGGRTPTKLHFNVGKEEIAETILTKLDDSRKLAISNAKAASEATSKELHAQRSARTPPPYPVETSSPSKKNGVSVRFTEQSPEIIPPREPSEEGEAEEVVDSSGDDQGGELAAALYDFEGTGPDELSVREGERLYIIEKEGEEWWKCRNAQGDEGVVPASYLESLGSSTPTRLDDNDRARKEQERKETERRDREARELADKERKKAEQERARAAAEAQRTRQAKERTPAAAEATSAKPRPETDKHAQQKSEGEQGISIPRSSGSTPRNASTRSSGEHKSAPPPDSTRIWHDRSGQFRVEAALLGYSNGKLRLHKVNGVVIEVPSEKMSVEDMRYVERLMKRKSSSSGAGASLRATIDDDDKPLAPKRPPEATKREPQKKGPQVDWFEFFLSAGCDIDDCTRYANSFERDKMDESLLPDITESTMRSLGLREGDIIRVNKVIQQKYAKPQVPPPDHLVGDEDLARQLQEEENSKKSVSPAPNLFAGPGGALKNNAQRRGRPQSGKNSLPSTVDLDSIGTASEQIKRSGSPLVRTSSPAMISPVQPPQRSSSAMATVSGFDDDAWTNRPGSKPPAANPTPPAGVPPPRATSVPPTAPVVPAPVPNPPVPPQEAAPVGSGSLAKTTEADIFDQLARLSQLSTNRTSPSSTSVPPVTSPPVVSPPSGYNNGLGMGSSPSPIGHHLQNQQTGMFPPSQQNGPRGPYAPVPANQGLLQPLVPTQTGFGGFVSTRLLNTSPFQPHSQPAQPTFLQPQVTGFPSNPQMINPQPTGFPTAGPMLSQPTGINGGGFTGVAPVQTNPTGFAPYGQSPFNNVVSTPSPAGPFGQSPFNNVVSTPSPAGPFGQSPFNNIMSTPSSAPPNNISSTNTSPANIFAQMKSGTFASGNEHAVPQQAEKYDALRVNAQPTGWVPQPTGWGIQPNAGFQNGYTGY